MGQHGPPVRGPVPPVQRYAELVDFLYGKNRHEDALSMLTSYGGGALARPVLWRV